MNLTSKLAIKSMISTDCSAIKAIYLILLSYLLLSMGMEYYSGAPANQSNIFSHVLENLLPFVLIAWIAQLSNRITKANQRLESENQALARAHCQDRRMATLAETGQLFHACQSVEEILELACERLQYLLPKTSGGLYLTNDACDVLEKAMAWGEAGKQVVSFPPNDCWALRCGRTHHTNGHDAAACRHINVDEADWHMCLPLTAQGERLGLMVVRGRVGSGDQISASDWGSEAQMPFYTKLAEILALAIANLRVREALYGQAIRDPLTQLFNRRYFQETLERELHRIARSGEPLCLAMLDIDHFKQFNDSFGHDAGDAVLRAVAGVLKEQTRLSDIACRYGGEELALVFPGMPPEVMVRRMETVRQQIEALVVQHSGQPLDQVTISAGIAVYPNDATDVDALITAADQALYQSKRSGRNRVTLAPVSRRTIGGSSGGLDHGGESTPQQPGSFEPNGNILRLADHRRARTTTQQATLQAV